MNHGRDGGRHRPASTTHGWSGSHTGDAGGDRPTWDLHRLARPAAPIAPPPQAHHHPAGPPPPADAFRPGLPVHPQVTNAGDAPVVTPPPQGWPGGPEALWRERSVSPADLQPSRPARAGGEPYPPPWNHVHAQTDDSHYQQAYPAAVGHDAPPDPGSSPPPPGTGDLPVAPKRRRWDALLAAGPGHPFRKKIRMRSLHSLLGSFVSFLWSCVLWLVFTVSLIGAVAGARLLDVDGTQKQLVSYGSIVVSTVAGSLLAKREPLKSILASRKVQWFLFLFNGVVAAAAYFYVGGPKGIGAAVGMGLVSLGAGFGLLKRPHHTPSAPAMNTQGQRPTGAAVTSADTPWPAAVRPAGVSPDNFVSPPPMDLEEALRELIPQNRTREERTDLIAAAAEAWRRRHVNTKAGAAVIAALGDSGLSYTQISYLTGIPASEVHRWALTASREVM